jgi:hypothetical protein
MKHATITIMIMMLVSFLIGAVLALVAAINSVYQQLKGKGKNNYGKKNT